MLVLGALRSLTFGHGMSELPRHGSQVAGASRRGEGADFGIFGASQQREVEGGGVVIELEFGKRP